MPEFFSVVNESSGIPILNSDAEATPGQVYIISNLPPTAPVISGVAGDGLVTIMVTTAATDVEDGTVNLYNIYVDGVLHESNVTILQGGSHDVLGLTNGVQVAITLKAKDSAGALSIDSNTVVATPMAGTVTRTSTGKLVYADFTSDIEPFVEDTTIGFAGACSLIQWDGSQALKIIVGAEKGGAARASIAPAESRPIYATWKTGMLGVDNSGSRLYLIVNSDFTNHYSVQLNADLSDGRIVKRVSGTDTILATGTFSGDVNAHEMAVKLDASTITFYKDGLVFLNTSDNSHSNFDTVILLGAGTPGSSGGAYFDNVAICSDFNIVCTGLPTGYKLRIGGASGKVSIESSGTAIVDCSGMMFPQSLVEILDGSDNIVKSTTLTNDVWGGDVYAY